MPPYGHLVRILHWCSDQAMTRALEEMELDRHSRIDEVSEKLAAAVADVNGAVQSYKRMDLFLRRDEEFEKNTSRKIKRAGILESVMPDYIARIRG